MVHLLFIRLRLHYIFIVRMSKQILVINNTIPYPVYQLLNLLNKEGYQVDVVYDSSSGLQQLDDQDYDIIIVQDSHEAESWQLCEQIRHLSDMPLIVISTNASAETSVKAINGGADYFMRKPFGPLELLARVQSLLQRTPPKQAVPAGL